MGNAVMGYSDKVDDSEDGMPGLIYADYEDSDDDDVPLYTLMLR